MAAHIGIHYGGDMDYRLDYPAVMGSVETVDQLMPVTAQKADKIIYIAERREAFHQECLKYVGKYDDKRLADFYRYFSEANPRTGKMRFEGKRYWDLESRLERWMNTSFCSDNTAAEIRLDRTRKRQAKESADSDQQQLIAKQQQAIIAEREAENQQRELALEQSRQNSISLEEYAQRNPNSKLAKMFSKKGGA